MKWLGTKATPNLNSHTAAQYQANPNPPSSAKAPSPQTTRNERSQAEPKNTNTSAPSLAQPNKVVLTQTDTGNLHHKTHRNCKAVPPTPVAATRAIAASILRYRCINACRLSGYLFGRDICKNHLREGICRLRIIFDGIKVWDLGRGTNDAMMFG